MKRPVRLGGAPVALTAGSVSTRAEPRSVKTGQLRAVVLHVLGPQRPAGFFLHELSLAIDDTEDEECQEHGGQGAADDRSQGRVPRTGGRGCDLHQVDLAGTVWFIRRRGVPTRHALHVLKSNQLRLPIKPRQAVPTHGVTGDGAICLLKAVCKRTVQTRLAFLEAPVLLEPVRPACHTVCILPVAEATFLR